jgi:general secretion pathway protein D
MKRFAGWIAVVAPAVTAAAWIAVAGDNSNLGRLLDSLDAPTGAARPVQVAQADAAAPAPAPNLDALLGGTKPAPTPEAPAPAPEAPPPAPVAPPAMPEAPVPAPAPAPEAAAPAPAPEAPAAEAKPAVSGAQLEEQERVRRQAEEKEGLMALADALEAMRNEQYQVAFDKFTIAESKIQVREATEEARRTAKAGRAEAAMKLAEAAYAARNVTDADKWLTEAKKDEEGQGRNVRRLTSRLEDLKEEVATRGNIPVPVKRMPVVVAKKATTEEMVELGRQLFEVEEYDDAETAFEQALRSDPYSKDAMKFLRKIEERRLKISELHRTATRVDMIQDVVDRWNPPLRTTNITPPKPDVQDKSGTATAKRIVQEKMQATIIPTIEFRQANIVDVINFLRDASEAADPAGGGVNIILKLDNVGSGPALAPTAAPADPLAPAAGAGVGEVAGAGSIPLITLNLRRVTLLDAIKYVTDVAGLKYRIDENAVIITPANAIQENVVTRLYPVQPSILEMVTTKVDTDAGAASRGDFVAMGAGGAPAIDAQKDMKKFFGDMGVPFPPGSSIAYNSTISQLIVRNTAENLEIFERILAALNVVPNQVEIEARFVEIGENDLSELGVEWMLTDAWELANQKGTGPIQSRPRVQMNGNSVGGGFTHGLRYFTSSGDSLTPAARTTSNAGNMQGSVLSLSSILTNPELTMILHALEQKGGTDLLSSPRVTTRSGVNAQIKIVQEIIYPTEFESQSVGDLIAGTASSATGMALDPYRSRPPIPGSFETREIGVILNATPTVGPDGYTIDLTLVPEVAEFVRWIDYGAADLYPILQPVFASRNVTTSIVLWDGQTVVMGGLIRDQTTSVDDKIPLLGDLPILGHLFRNKGKHSEKQNLVIFVTAKLVDPAGNPIHQKTKSVMGEGRSGNQL